MLLDQIKAEINAALKKGDSGRVETLRFLVAAISNEAINKYQAAGESKITDEDVLSVIKRQVKTHHESIEAFTRGNRPELVAKEKAQLDILETYLPKQLSDEELKKLLEPVVSSGETNLPAGRQDFGLMMKKAMAVVGGKADGGRVAGLLKQMMTK